MGFSQKNGASIVEQSGANRRPDIGREVPIGYHYRCSSYFCYYIVIAVTCL